jgi:predicted nuclease of predicted toxin-antitoxin system
VTIWLDAQLSPALAIWITLRFGIEATPVRDLKLREAEDEEIFSAAANEGVVVMTKDDDFVRLLERNGPPPQIIWLRCGNTSNAYLRQLLNATLPDVLAMLEAGEPLVEITDPWRRARCPEHDA